MRLATNDAQEFRFWLTRHFVKALRPHLGQSLTSQPRIRTQASPVAQRELLKFEHEEAVNSSDFSTPYEASDKQLPLGEQPTLLTRFQIRPKTNGNITLAIGPETGNGIDLSLNSGLIHSILALMDKAIQVAEWELGETIETAELTAAESASSALN